MSDGRGTSHHGTGGGGFDLRRGLMAALERATTAILNWLATKPTAIFVWWLTSRANETDFPERSALRSHVAEAWRAGRPVLFASNHLSMFDDPVVPMTLYRTGPRAAGDLVVLGGILLVASLVQPGSLLSPTIASAAAAAWVVGAGLWGARKEWWSLGDLLNFSSADGLRTKLETRSGRAPGALRRALLSLADPIIYYFMRSGAVKTVFVDRRGGDESKRARGRSVEETVDIAARAEPIWIFFEGGRAKVPGEIGRARRGIGDIVIGLRARGLDPLVVAVHHRGLERVIPRGSSRWITSGHRIEVRWSRIALPHSDDAQDVANAAREEVVRLGALRRERA